jgi:hypothetical protein
MGISLSPSGRRHQLITNKRAPEAMPRNDGNGDKGSNEHRRAKAPCAHIAIVQVVAPNARERPEAEGQPEGLTAI